MLGYKVAYAPEQLEALIKQMPMTEIVKMFGVSDNAVKKRCKRLGVELKSMRGYWSKIRAGKCRLKPIQFLLATNG